MNIGIVGLGKLGLPMLSAFVKKGFNVRGFDIKPSTISLLRQRIIPIKEDGLSEIMNADPIWESRFTNSVEDIFNFSNILFLILPTPSKEDGTFNSSFIEQSLKQFNEFARDKKTHKDIVISSTLNPNDCKRFQHMFESVNLVYSPEFIALGSVLHDMLNPCTCIIGSNSHELSLKIQSVYEKLYDSTPQYFHLGFTESEIAKISINSYITMKISFANTIGSFIYEMTDGNTKSIANTLQAIGSDVRINNRYFKFGTGYGGPCFPRDNRCLSVHLKSKNINSTLPSSSDSLNDWLLEFFKKKIDISKYKNIVYVGLSYKNKSDFVEESFILKLHGLILQPNKKYYFIDSKIEKYNSLIKLDNIDKLSTDETLFLVNYADDEILSQLNNKNVFNFWA